MLLVPVLIPGEALLGVSTVSCLLFPSDQKKIISNYKLLVFFSICPHFLLINPPFFSTFVSSETCKSGLMKLISVLIGQQTQKVHINVIHSKSHLAFHLRRNPSGRLKALWKGPCPHVPPPPPCIVGTVFNRN